MGTYLRYTTVYTVFSPTAQDVNDIYLPCSECMIKQPGGEASNEYGYTYKLCIS